MFNNLEVVFLNQHECHILNHDNNVLYNFTLTGEVWMIDESFDHEFGQQICIQEYHDFDLSLQNNTTSEDFTKSIENFVKDLIVEEWVEIYKSNNSLFVKGY